MTCVPHVTHPTYSGVAQAGPAQTDVVTYDKGLCLEVKGKTAAQGVSKFLIDIAGNDAADIIGFETFCTDHRILPFLYLIGHFFRRHQIFGPGINRPQGRSIDDGNIPVLDDDIGPGQFTQDKS